MYKRQVVRLQFITRSLYKITHVSSQKNSDLVKFMIMKFKFICQLVFEMKNAEIAVEITAFAIFFDWVSAVSYTHLYRGAVAPQCGDLG